MKRIFTLFTFALLLAWQAQAQFNSPFGVVFDEASNRYLVANSTGTGSNVLEVTTAGAASGFLVNPMTTLSDPRGMVITNGYLYVLDFEGAAYNIEEYALPGGAWQQSISLTGASLQYMTTDHAGNLYVSDWFGASVLKVEISSGTVTTLANGLGTPRGIVYDAANSRLLVGKSGNNANIDAIALPGGGVTTVVTGSGINNMEGLGMDGCGRLYVVSAGGNNVTQYDNNLMNPSVVATGLNGPRGIGVDNTNGGILVANSSNNTVTVASVTIPSPTATINTAASTVCDGGTQTLSATATNAGSVMWTASAGSFSNATIDNPVYTPPAGAGSHTLYYTATSGQGCGTDVDSVVITVSAPPVANAGGPYNNVCVDNCINLSGSGSNGDIMWSDGGVGGTFTPNNTNNTQYCPPAGYTGQVTFTQTVSDPAAICTDATSTASIMVNAAPTASIFQGDTTVCTSSTLQLVGLPTGEDSVAWSSTPAASFTPASQNFTSFIPTSGTGTYTVRFSAFGAAGCPTAMDSIMVTVDPGPDSAIIQTPDTELCDLTSLDITATTPAIGTGMWSVESGTGTFTDATAAMTTVNGLQMGANTLRWTVSNSICTPNMAEVTVTVGASSTANFNFNVTDLDATFNNTSNNATSYEWDFGDGGSSTDASPSHTYSAAGDYNVCLITTSDQICPPDTTCQMVTATDPVNGIFGTPVEAMVSVVPNPSNGQFFLTFNQWDTYQVVVYGALGQTLVTKQIQGANGHLDLSGFANGVYFLEVQGELTKQRHQARLVVNH